MSTICTHDCFFTIKTCSLLSPHFICWLFSLSPFQQRCRFSTTNFKLYCPLHYAEFIHHGINWNDPGNSVFYNENYILGKLTGQTLCTCKTCMDTYNCSIYHKTCYNISKTQLKNPLITQLLTKQFSYYAFHDQEHIIVY